MITVALIAFGTLLAAWLLAPAEPRLPRELRHEAEPTISDAPIPRAA